MAEYSLSTIAHLLPRGLVLVRTFDNRGYKHFHIRPASDFENPCSSVYSTTDRDAAWEKWKEYGGWK